MKKYRDRSHSHDDDAAFTCEALTDEYAVVCPKDAFPEGNQDLGRKGTFFRRKIRISSRGGGGAEGTFT